MEFDNCRIKVTNTAIIIDNYTLHENEKLEKPFQIYDPIMHKISYQGLYYDEPNKRLYLPAGMDLWYVKSALGEKYYTRLTHTPYKTMNSNIGIKFRPRDDRQEEALRFMCGIGEYEQNANLNQLSVNLNTGVGKSYCSIATMAFYKINSIVITGSNSLLSQWESEILKYSNIKQEEIIRISGSDYCNMILCGNSGKANKGKVFLCSHGTLRSFGERYGMEKIGKLFELLGIGLKFYDEAHTNFYNMNMIDFFTNTFKTYYVTATPGRSNWRENKIFQISLKNVPGIDLFDERLNHTSYIAIKWNSNPSAGAISACKNPVYGLDRNKYINYLTTKKEFYDMLRIIMDMVISAIKKGGRVLLYIGTNDGILRVYYWIAQNYPEFLGDIGIFTSIVDKEDKLEEKKKKILLSTTKSAGLGEHIEGLKMTILLAEPFKSEILARQTLGRTRDDNTLYIELVDLGFLYCRKFYNAKLPVFNKYAKDVSDTTIDSHELYRRSEILEKERQHWQYPAIALDDKRFDFDAVIPKFMKKDENPDGPIQAIRFFPKNNSKIFHK